MRRVWWPFCLVTTVSGVLCVWWAPPPEMKGNHFWNYENPMIVNEQPMKIKWKATKNIRTSTRVPNSMHRVGWPLRLVTIVVCFCCVCWASRLVTIVSGDLCVNYGHSMTCYSMAWQAIACHGMLWHDMACVGMLGYATTCSDLSPHALTLSVMKRAPRSLLRQVCKMAVSPRTALKNGAWRTPICNA